MSDATHDLSVLFLPNWSAVGGDWFATEPSDDSAGGGGAPPFIASIWRRLPSGHEHAGLPDSCQDLTPVVDMALALLSEAYRPVDFDELDLTLGWTDEKSRLKFLEVTEHLEKRLRRRLRRQWTVRVSPSPGVVEVTLMGEYMCDWPLWTHHGLSDPDDWTMLSHDVRTGLVRERRIDPRTDIDAVRRAAAEAVAEHEQRSLTGAVRALDEPDHVVGQLLADLVGFGPLQRFLDDPEVEEVSTEPRGRVAHQCR